MTMGENIELRKYRQAEISLKKLELQMQLIRNEYDAELISKAQYKEYCDKLANAILSIQL